MDVLVKDERFAVVARDPRFRRVPREERKVKIDKRFQGMFTDKRFKLKYSVDKRGRPDHQTSTENLKKFYDLDSDEEDAEEVDIDQGNNGDDEGDNTVEVLHTVTGAQSDQSVKKKKKGRRRSGRELLLDFKRRKARTQNAPNSSSLRVSSDPFRKTPACVSRNESGINDQNKDVFRQPLSGEKEGSSSNDDDDDDYDLEEGDYSESGDEVESGLGSDEASDDKLTSKNSTSGSKLSSPRQKQIGIDLARGEGNVETSSSDSDSDSDARGDGPSSRDSLEAPAAVELGHKWGELDGDAPREESTSRRLAVCNIDWDCVTASDLFVLLNSFKPAGGVLHSVKIYPSEFGVERMKEEDAKGPQELVEEDEKRERLEGIHQERYQREKLRKYQLQRLKYYYAVVDCDSANTANTIYEQCDGMEYETSSSKLDLRFIPDDMSFEHDPKDAATDLPDAAQYKPMEFQTTALHQSKVELTWDENDKRRAQKTAEAFSRKKNLEEIESHIHAYLDSPSEEEEEDDDDGGDEGEEQSGMNEEKRGSRRPISEEDRINRYQNLLRGIEEKEHRDKEDREMEMEITWEPGLKETTEGMIRKKVETASSTPWEKYLDKKKEKKKENRKENRKMKKQQMNKPAETAISSGEKTEGDFQTFSDDDLPEDINLADSYFRNSLRDTSAPATATRGKRKPKPGGSEKTEEEIEEERRKKAALELLVLDEHDDGKQHFNLKCIMENENMTKSKRKRQLKQQRKLGQSEMAATAPAAPDNFEIDTADPRFEALFTSHEYAIDPSSPRFKKTKGMSTLITEKQRRREVKGMESSAHRDDGRKEEEEKKSDGKRKFEISQLVRSIKNKTEQHHSRKKLKGD